MKLLEPEFSHTDSRRKLEQLVTDSIKQVNVYHANRGAVLGNHYHKKTTEYFYIAKGSVTYNDSQVVNKGSIFVVYPQEKHTIECLTDVTMMTFLTHAYKEEDKDIYG